MEEFKSIDFHDEPTGLHFHKLNPEKFGPDRHYYSMLNSWGDSPNIQEFLPTPLGDKMRPEDEHSDHYIIQDESMEVIGSVKLLPNSPIIGNLDLLYYTNTYDGDIKNSYASLVFAHKLLTKGASGLYIASFVSTPKKEHCGNGTKILKGIINNSTILNRNIPPFCIMAMVREDNHICKKTFQKFFKTIPTGYEFYNKYYFLTSPEP